ncbi:universal stress protein [Kitasatospora kifunensis]|uniref:Nucleotide-binding universal stress UspA family protein n=1 Tax=Kitasatospora kifunensis TaxID=58351 RepID=A0A7W7VYN2_KITKI|nr:universal stress protein [Kitasatospora kifunensis]MBB4927676.1 nucleotide-binding universal stress UspA family protein [Kitasatospora kifunensis]
MSVLVKRVVVGVDGSEGSLAALKQAAYEAIRHRAELCPVLAWELPGGEVLASSQPTPFPAFKDVCHRAEQEAEGRLAAACEAVLTEIPEIPDSLDSLDVHPRVLRAQPGPALVACSQRSTDLLVVGVGGHGRVYRLRHRSARRHCLKHAHCPVLVVSRTPHSTPAPDSPGAASVRELPLPTKLR